MRLELRKTNPLELGILILFIIAFGIWLDDFNEFIALSITFYILLKAVYNTNHYFIFKEWVMFLYALNYLISPMLAYKFGAEEKVFGMKIESEEYFSLAIPGMLFFYLGLNLLKTKVFFVKTTEMQQSTLLNSKFLVGITVFSLLIRIINSGEYSALNFFLYLISLLRYVSSFSLFALNPSKYWKWPTIILLIDLYYSLTIGMYHDFIMWLVFFVIFSFVIIKPTIQIKFILFSLLFLVVLFFQAIKFAYRQEAWSGGKQANLELVAQIGSDKVNTDSIIGVQNLISLLNRGNQAWIFASTVDNLNRTKDFQGLKNVNKYLEAAILPRFLAPNKIESGSNEIFNEFSGHVINDQTSMGLGIFADGYIAYGAWGVYIFGFALGLIFALTFKLVERWSKISPFYVLLLLPLLNYAVRPDCELQTTINHLFKGVLLYGFLVYLTRKRFTLDSQENKRKLVHLNLLSSK